MRSAFGHRSAIAGSQSRRGGEEGSYVQEQCSTPMAICHSRSTRSRGEKIFRKVLRGLHRSHQYSPVAVYLAEGRSDPRRRVPRERELRFLDSTAGQSGRRQ